MPSEAAFAPTLRNSASIFTSHFTSTLVPLQKHSDTSPVFVVPGFNATIRFDEGVRRVAQEHLRHPELQVEDQEFDALSDRFVKLMDALGQAAAQL